MIVNKVSCVTYLILCFDCLLTERSPDCVLRETGSKCRGRDTSFILRRIHLLLCERAFTDAHNITVVVVVIKNK